MLTAVIVIGAVLMLIWALSLVRGGHLQDERMRRAMVLQEARNWTPDASEVEAVYALYCKKLRLIVQFRNEGKETDDLEDDLRILMGEHNRLIREDVERQSSFVKTMAR